MANNASFKKVSHKQQTTSYALYMIVSSYFKKCTCKSPLSEQNLFLYYQEMDTGKQVQLEEQIISHLENTFAEQLEYFAELNCDVYIRRASEKYRIIFYTGFEGLVISVDQNGKYIIRFYDLDPEDRRAE